MPCGLVAFLFCCRLVLTPYFSAARVSLQRLYSVIHIQPYAIHTTFQFSGADGKRHRLREALHFRDPKSTMTLPMGLYRSPPKSPLHCSRGATHTLETHFELMNYQVCGPPSPSVGIFHVLVK